MKIRSRLIPIGDEQGVIIPANLLDHARIENHVTLEISGDEIIIRPLKSPRKGWDAAFKEMADHDHDFLPDDVARTSEWDQKNWEW